jgi:hypothetical protein
MYFVLTGFAAKNKFLSSRQVIDTQSNNQLFEVAKEEFHLFYLQFVIRGRQHQATQFRV